MEKYFVTDSQAVALKELGFDMPCFRYIYTGDTGNNVDRYEETEPSRAINFNHDSLSISQPLKSQVFEWMRDKHILSAHIDDFTANDGQVRYDFSIRELGSQDDNPNGVYEEYSDAESGCIDALIKRVKQRL